MAVPSLWPEPFGLIGIEAFGCGRPVVASDTGGVREWLEPGVNGLAVAPGRPRALAAALSELLADPVRQARMGAAGAPRPRPASPSRPTSRLCSPPTPRHGASWHRRPAVDTRRGPGAPYGPGAPAAPDSSATSRELL